ncbi:MAG TPA: Smr/MutS family protein, partial [Hyphomicrobiales bacterium]|nr:Smr/MutS family protein [Hyphomicrobiales bacterium]
MSRRRPLNLPPLDPEERKLWEKVVEQAKPLRRAPPEPGKAEAPAEPPMPKRRDKPRPAPAPRAAPAGATKPPPLGTIDRRTTQRRGRGLRRVEGRIDLHGMRQAEAQEALYAFLTRAQARGLGLVLVITGKGGPSAREEAG